MVSREMHALELIDFIIHSLSLIVVLKVFDTSDKCNMCSFPLDLGMESTKN